MNGGLGPARARGSWSSPVRLLIRGDVAKPACVPGTAPSYACVQFPCFSATSGCAGVRPPTWGVLRHPRGTGPRLQWQGHGPSLTCTQLLLSGPSQREWVLPPCGWQAVHATAKILSLQGLRGTSPAARQRPGWPVSVASLGHVSNTAQPLQWQGHPDPKSPSSQGHPKFWATQPRVKSQAPGARTWAPWRGLEHPVAYFSVSQRQSSLAP